MKASKDDELKKVTGNIIRTMRKSRGMTQEDLARAIDQSSSSIAMYENGRREPEFVTLEALADVFNVPIQTLVPVRNTVMNLQLFSESELTAKEKYVLKTYRSLPEKGKRYIHDQLKYAVYRYSDKADDPEDANPAD